MSAKFQIGDKVRINNNAPSFMRELRRRTRTVVALHYDTKAQHRLYELGDKGHGSSLGYLFRPLMLTKVNWGFNHLKGRPRVSKHSLTYLLQS